MKNREIKKLVDDLEPKVERLKSLYQQYFMGIEKLPPAALKRDVTRAIYELRKKRLQNTATKFKFQMIVQRLNTYQQYWTRILRQIENGTYKRDVRRAAQRFGKSEALAAAGAQAEIALRDLDDEESVPVEVEWEIDESSDWEQPAAPQRVRDPQQQAPGVYTLSEDPEQDAYDAQVYEQQRLAYEAEQRRYQEELRVYEAKKRAYEAYQRQLAEQQQQAAAPHAGHVEHGPPAARGRRGGALPGARRARPTGTGTAPDRATREIYNKYVQARRQAGESTANITYDKLAKSLQTQRRNLKKKHAGRDVDFEVVTKNGRPMIRPVIK